MTFDEERFDTERSQWLAHLLSLSPMAFQALLVARRRGLLSALDAAGSAGLDAAEMGAALGLGDYATGVVREALLVCGVTMRAAAGDRDRLSKVGWFMVRDEAVGVNMDFSADVCYRASAHLEASLAEGRPAGLGELGSWPTVYEGLMELPEPARSSWFGFDHFYSDGAFEAALDVLLSAGEPSWLLDVGGNTGRFARRVLARTASTRVTLCDLPQQTARLETCARLDACPVDVLSPDGRLPQGADMVWMSQFLDCFSANDVVDILRKCVASLAAGGSIAVLETFWDNQRYATGALDLGLTSLYFTAVANGRSKMYGRSEFQRLIERAGLGVRGEWGLFGRGHTLLLLAPR